MQRQDYFKKVKSTCNWYDFKFQTVFFHIVPKGDMCITPLNPLWRSVVYRRIMTSVCNNRGRMSITLGIANRYNTETLKDKKDYIIGTPVHSSWQGKTEQQ